MSDDKPVVEVSVTDVDFVAVEPGLQGGLRILLLTNHAQHLALILPPRVLATLESKLAEARELQAKSSGIQ